jgi:hypothetical protein
LPLALNDTWNNTLVGGNATVSESAADRTEFIYDTSGNMISKKYYLYTGGGFVIENEEVYTYNTNNDYYLAQFIDHSSGVPVVTFIDSLLYNAANDLNQISRYRWDGSSAYYASFRAVFTYSGSDIANTKVYEGDISTPLSWTLDAYYTYTGGNMTNVTGYQITNNAPNPYPFTVVDYTYGSNGKLALHHGHLNGVNFNQYVYTYDSDDFLTSITQRIWDSGNAAYYDYEVTKFYYQNTADVNEIEVTEASVFPNPSTDFVTISADSEIESVAVFNANGLIVITQKGGDLDISNLSAGVYIAKVKTSTGIAQERFVKH